MASNNKACATVNVFKPGQSDFNAVMDPPGGPEGDSVALCFSGGGSRACSAAMGQLRGLRHLGLLDKTHCITGVSGGAWASTVYSYVPETISDDDLLGQVCEDPARLSLLQHGNQRSGCELDYLPEHNIGRIPGRINPVDAAADALEWFAEGIPPEETWIRLVGKYILEDYQRYNGYGVSNYFTRDASWFDDHIGNNNPQLSSADFYTVPNDRWRPSLLIQGSLIPSEKEHHYRLLPVLFTPYGCGVIAEFPAAGAQTADIGGGAIDPFGMSSTQQQGTEQTLQSVELPQNKFSLADMAGISSTFYAELLSSKLPGDHKSLIPRYNYWPVMNADSTPARSYGFADGGNLENTGIASTLRFSPKNIIAFVNSPTPLSWDDSYKCPIIDGQLPPLFGYQPYTSGATWPGQTWAYRRFPAPGSDEPLLDASYATASDNQVFPAEAFPELLTQLWQAAQRGGSALCFQQGLQRVANPKFGVEPGTVNILWAYNNPVTSWREQLSLEVKAYMELDPLMHSFPCYPTLDVDLSARQVNLLAHLCCWTITSDSTLSDKDGLSNRQMFARMYNH